MTQHAINITGSGRHVTITATGGVGVCVVRRPNILVCVERRICISVQRVGVADFGYYLRNLDQYESDDAAITAGKDIYLASNSDYVNGSHNGAYPGSLIVLK